MEAVIFYFFSGLAIVSALLVIFLSQPAKALLSLIVTMFSLGILYVLLGAHFVAIANIIVYAGAVLVLFLFVIMLQGVGARDIPFSQRFHPLYLLLAVITALAFLTMLAVILWNQSLPEAAGVIGTVEAIGRILFKNFIIHFELTAVLLLLGVFAAVALAKEEPGDRS